MPILICEPLNRLLRSGLTRSHDLSWGTKGSDTVQAVDLGAIQGVGRHVQVELVSAQQDIDIAYQDALDNIRLKRGRVDADELPPKRDATEQEQKDSYVSLIISICN
jgi:chitin synthase